MPARTDIHRYAVRLEVALRGLEKASIPVEDKLSIREFSEVLRSEGLNLGRVAKYVYHMKTVAQKLSESGTTLNGADPSSLKGFMRWVNESGVYRPYTKRDFIVVMKRFYQWLRAPPNEYSSWRKKHTYPPEVDDFSSTIKLNERVLPDDLLTADDVQKLTDAASHSMVRAYISFSDEIGPRAGEALTMRLKSIVHDSQNIYCRIGGKTGERRVLLVRSTRLIGIWLDEHPLKDDPDAPLWINHGARNRLQSWSYHACKKELRELAKRANLKKKLYPHLFRHSAATRDARLGFTEMQLCKKYGWVLGSRMPAVYIHLSGADLDRTILEKYGEMESARPEPQIIKCPRCSATNSPVQRHCGTCGSALRPGPETIVEEMTERNSKIVEEKYVEEIARLTARTTDLERQLVEILAVARSQSPAGSPSPRPTALPQGRSSGS